MCVPRACRSLQGTFGVTGELFASPLNHTLPLYCTAFSDVDAPFGSHGSFFSSSLILGDDETPSGSYQLNPPFSAPLYEALVERCHTFLAHADAAGKALSFALVIGATAPALALPCIATLHSSSFYRGELIVGVNKHVYVCGRQFMKPTSATFRACDTGAYFLQTRAAATRWPVNDAKLAKLRAAFEATNANR